MTDRSVAVAELVSSLPAGVVATTPEALEKYRQDWAKDPDAGMPCACVRAESPDHVQVAVRWAASHGIPVVPRGAGSGLSGGASAVEGGLVISLERMTAIEIDPAARCAVVEPGTFNADVKKAAAEHGLWYPPDPSSFEICSIGGNVATNAGGLCCVKYGVTTDYVLGLDVVLADGRLITLGGKRIKDVAGLSLLKLFVGSEGTLGIVTRATLRLIPAQLAPSTLVATFDSVRAAADAVVAMGRVVRASMVELMDKPTVNQVEDFAPMGLDRDRALLIVQSDAPEGAREQEMAIIEMACRDAGSVDVFVTHDAAEGAQFVQARRLAFPAAEAAGSLLLEDVGVPVPLLPDLVARVEQIGVERGVDVVCVAHAGDGNTHPIVMYDAADPDSTQRARAAFDDILTAAIELGGTITGEHGVGRLKRDALPAMLGPDIMELNQRVKDALDPQGILNPGSVLAARP
ncbi:FAD-linked oxidase [Knoellia subterranea KCTC 19937]|uniref:FAD-linked oxidase n=1 Tax=Knoellia subterranea KCTC 19937 TaxID=1385521 RepID=A0A0A0JMA6_9MICO|nr:FAD-linked oxidase C-terminal domain-containing protein [Knoellia subterranea]KGN37192.1 FAD-linked oxidase [Knoellia subterranea KCTC 19937]